MAARRSHDLRHYRTIALVDDCGTLLKMLLIVDPPCTRAERLIWDFIVSHYTDTHMQRHK